MWYIGIDVGKRRCRACVVDDEGGVIEEFSFDNTSKGVQRVLDRVSGQSCRAVVESTGNLWLRIYERLEDHGIPVKLANPYKTSAIAEARIKTDKLSARILADLLRADLIAECYVASPEIRRVRAVIRQRASLVRMRTMVKNRVHSLLDRYGFRSPWSDTFGVGGRRWLRSLEIDQVDRCILDTHLRHLECLNSEIEVLDSWIAAQAAESEDALLLMTLTGVSHFGALLLSTEIADITRFPSPKKLISWAGLCPSLHQSGDTVHSGRMKKDSNKRVRWMLVQSARSASRTDPRMRQLYQRVAARRGDAKAVIRVANKMATIIWHMLTKRQPYHQVKEELYRSKLKRMTRIAG